jgi:hypothetical protein
MKTTRQSVTVLELKRLLIDLKTYQPNTCIRLRLLGEMWFPKFMNVVLITDKGIVLNDETSTKLRVISSLTSIMQFEIDQSYQAFQPHFHYDVLPSDEF